MKGEKRPTDCRDKGTSNRGQTKKCHKTSVVRDLANETKRKVLIPITPLALDATESCAVDIVNGSLTVKIPTVP